MQLISTFHTLITKEKRFYCNSTYIVIQNKNNIIPYRQITVYVFTQVIATSQETKEGAPTLYEITFCSEYNFER